MSIGEVSKAIGITRRIILNYEAKGLLLPDKKDIEEIKVKVEAYIKLAEQLLKLM